MRENNKGCLLLSVSRVAISTCDVQIYLKMVLHIHKCETDLLDLHNVANNFVAVKESKLRMFGKFNDRIVIVFFMQLRVRNVADLCTRWRWPYHIRVGCYGSVPGPTVATPKDLAGA